MKAATCIVIAAFCIVANAFTTFRANPNDFTYTGRFDFSVAGEVRYDWTQVSILFGFSGTSLTVLLVETQTKGNQYSVTVDGKPLPVLAANSSTTVYPIISGLPSGSHTASLVKRTEALFGPVRFMGIQLDDGAELIPLPKAKSADGLSNSNGPKLEFLGDSLSCGYGNLGTPPCNFTADTEDGTRSFPALTAGLLGASMFHQQCWSGKGVVRNYGDKNTTSQDPFPSYYPRSVANLPETQWDFSSYQPDIVVILLGANDYTTEPSPSYDQFSTGYFRLLDFLYGNYPNVQHIFCTCGPTWKEPCQFIQNIVNSYSDSRTKFATLAGVLDPKIPTDWGCNGHPSTQGDVKMANALYQQIQKAITV